MKRIIAIFIMLGIVTMVGACASNNNSSSTDSTTASGVTTTTTTSTPTTTSGIGPAGGTVNGTYGAQLAIPAGALAANVDLVVSRDSTSAPDFPPSGTGAAGAAFEITPHGTAFSVPATVSIPFDPALVPVESSPVLFKAEPGGSFTQIASTVSGSMLVADVTNLSWFIPAYAATKPRNIYALMNGTSVASFRINRTTGALSGPTSTAPTGPSPTAVVAHPSGRFAFITNGPGSTINGVPANSVSAYRIDAITGMISGPVSTAPSTTAVVQARPVMANVHPSGKFLYVVNYGQSGGNSDVSVFTIDPTTGGLTGPVSTADSGGAPTTALATSPSGSFAYVSYSWSSSTPFGNTYYNQIKVYSVNPTTGLLSGPTSGGVSAYSDTPWSMAVEPTGNFLYVGTVGNSSHYDTVSTYRINGTTGALTYQGNMTISSNPVSLSVDLLGRFLYVGKQSPFFNANAGGSVNVEVYKIDASTGLLTYAGAVLTGSGSLVGPIAVVAEPQGEFVYAMDINSELVSYKVSNTGSLTSANTVTGVTLPGSGGQYGVPFTFAATGTSPLWRNNYTIGGFMASVGSSSGGSSGGGGGGGGVPVGNGMHYLDVRNDPVWGGWIWSTPSGIDFGHTWVAAPPNQFSAQFATGTSVQLCMSPDPNQYQAYDVAWTGGCSGTGTCTNVTMDLDKHCYLTLTPRH